MSMPVDVRSLRASSRRLASSEGLDLQALVEGAIEVIAFGSRAAGVHSAHSDLDLLLVGEGPRLHTAHFDVIWKQPGEIESTHWLGSELGSHVAAYGVWLKGEGAWRREVKLARAAAVRKQRRICSLVGGMSVYWNRLSPDLRRKYLTMVRREGQRLWRLEDGIAIPPTPVLDSEWRTSREKANVWRRRLDSIRGPNTALRDTLRRLGDLILFTQQSPTAAYRVVTHSHELREALAGAAPSRRKTA